MEKIEYREVIKFFDLKGKKIQEIKDELASVLEFSNSRKFKFN